MASLAKTTSNTETTMSEPLPRVSAEADCSLYLLFGDIFVLNDASVGGLN